jgi:hypothetical protein
VDLPIGENLIGCAVAGIADPGNRDGQRSHDRDRRSRLQQKNHIQFRRGMRFYTEMKKNGHLSSSRRVMDYAVAAMEQMELYGAAHPGSPSAVRHPRLFFRSDLWIALLGPNVEEGIVGIGPTVAAALRAFDAQYLAGLRPPSEVIKVRRSSRSASAAPAA